MKRTLLSILLLLLVGVPALTQAPKGHYTIPTEEFRQRIEGFWLGQLVGNYMGLPFENVYVEEPAPVLIDSYITVDNRGDLQINDKDLRGYIHAYAQGMGGAFSDDDTDIEFVTLHAVEKHGLDITYEEITEAWITHINRRIWVANRTARNLMDEGLVAPATGAKENNRNWFQIDPQLVNEIWSMFYPAMPRAAAGRAEWGAKITNDDWGTHPTIAYAVMLSAGFFESDPETLVRMTLDYLPEASPFTEGVHDVLRWHSENPDWRTTRQLIHDKYYRYKNDEFEAPVSVVSSLNNGLAGIMAFLYGNGDFVRTVGLAVSAGYDCDNQAATLGGLIGAMKGSGAIPKRFTHELSSFVTWEKPFNDTYLNYTRDGLPIHNTITSIVDRIVAVAERAIFEAGGWLATVDGEQVYQIPVNQ